MFIFYVCIVKIYVAQIVVRREMNAYRRKDFNQRKTSVITDNEENNEIYIQKKGKLWISIDFYNSEKKTFTYPI